MSTTMKLYIEFIGSYSDQDQGTWCDTFRANVPIIVTGAVSSLGESYLNGGQDYRLYCALAGVRGDRTPLYAPRGLPSVVSRQIGKQLFVPVVEDATWTPLMSVVSVSEAKRKTEKGTAIFSVSRAGSFEEHRILDADIYGTSWLKLGEVEAALKHHDIKADEIPVPFSAILAAARRLEEGLGEDRVRLTFWFSG